MRKIRLGQGAAHACDHDGFHDLGTFDEAPGTLQGPGVPEGLATLRVSFDRL